MNVLHFNTKKKHLTFYFIKDKFKLDISSIVNLSEIKLKIANTNYTKKPIIIVTKASFA